MKYAKGKPCECRFEFLEQSFVDRLFTDASPGSLCHDCALGDQDGCHRVSFDSLHARAEKLGKWLQPLRFDLREAKALYQLGTPSDSEGEGVVGRTDGSFH
jgi:hypothetical protein